MYPPGYRLLFLALLCGAILWQPLDQDARPYGLYRFGRSRHSNDLTHLGFDRWPNKNGRMKSEFVFRPSDYPQLRGFEIRRDWKDKDGDDGSLMHSLWLEKGPSELTLEIETYRRSNGDAHAGLLNEVTSTSFPIAPHLRTGYRLGPDLGDVCVHYYDPISFPPSEWTLFNFVRNNIRVRIHASSDNGVNAFSLAQAIDERIRRSH
jgi:hypothetical protein